MMMTNQMRKTLEALERTLDALTAYLQAKT